MLPRIIAFSGKATAGKSTAAGLISTFYPCIRLSFAEPLKRMVAAEFCDVLTMRDIRENKNKIVDFGGKAMTVREILIEFGAMYRRIDPNFWVKKLVREMRPWIDAGRTVVVDDMRFVSEADFLRGMGARLVRIERPGVSLINDPSETSLDGYAFDQVIVNDGDELALLEKLRGLELQS